MELLKYYSYFKKVQGMYVSWKKKVSIDGESFMLDIHDTQEFDQYRPTHLDQVL